MKRISYLGLAISTIALLDGCGTMQRSARSGYSDVGGWSRGRPMSDDLEPRSRATSSDQTESRSELRRLEASIGSDVDRRQYYRIKPFLASDLERTEFLKLPDRSARERWVRALGVIEKGANERHVASAVEEGDIVMGMPKSAVLESWGDPIEREVAGNPEYENERWTYYNYVNSPDGYQREARIIYFESGRVIGWETR